MFLRLVNEAKVTQAMTQGKTAGKRKATTTKTANKRNTFLLPGRRA